MIEIKNLHKSFGKNNVLCGVNLNIETGETIVIIGKSGCGKSVLLKHIVGLILPDSGFIKVEDQTVNELDASASPPGESTLKIIAFTLSSSTAF